MKKVNLYQIEITVNDKVHSITVPPYLTLLELLRDSLLITSVKCGCDDANCGACTVLVDGKPVKSCNMLAMQVDGCKVVTIEGISSDGRLHPLQQSFIDHFAFQCGFCTPGMILTAKALLDRNPNPTEIQIREGLQGNLCRCTGYQSIVQSIIAVRDGKYS